jgi:phosphonate transport system ATP-binding protein
VTILRVADLCQSYSDVVPVLRAINLTVARGEFVGIIGLSGSGKSTLLRCINRLIEPSSGSIYVPLSFVAERSDSGALTNVIDLNRSQLRVLRRRIGMIFQQFNIVRRLSVVDNVLCGGLGYISITRGALRRFTKDEKRKALSNLKRVGLLEHAYRRADELSGGEQQRVAIARTLMQEPALILADEPVSSLDPKLSRVILDTLKRICREDGITALVSLHTLELTRAYADRVVGLKQGRVFFDAQTQELTDAVVHELYQHTSEDSL